MTLRKNDVKQSLTNQTTDIAQSSMKNFDWKVKVLVHFLPLFSCLVYVYGGNTLKYYFRQTKCDTESEKEMNNSAYDLYGYELNHTSRALCFIFCKVIS